MNQSVETIIKRNEKCAAAIAASLEKYLEADPEIAASVAEIVISNFYGYKISRKERIKNAVKNTRRRVGLFIGRHSETLTGFAIFIALLTVIGGGITLLVIYAAPRKLSVSDTSRFEKAAWSDQTCIETGFCVKNSLVDAANAELDALPVGQSVAIDDYRVKHQGKIFIVSY